MSRNALSIHGITSSDRKSIVPWNRSYRLLLHPEPELVVLVEGTRMKAVIHQDARVGGGERGKVTEYTSAARRRFQELFCSMATDVLLGSWAGRLSWADDTLPDGKEVKRCLKVLQTRLTQGWPAVCLMWRMEIEPRKSGEHVGRMVPHIHYVVVAHEGVELDVFAAWIQKAWHKITGSGDVNHTVDGIGAQLREVYGNPRMVSWYVSKYVTKSARENIAQGFGWTGRWWGVMGRKNFPRAKSEDIVLRGREIVELRRLVRAWLRRTKSGKRYAKKMSRNTGVGFSLLGIPARELKRMIGHAVMLAASQGDFPGGGTRE